MMEQVRGVVLPSPTVFREDGGVDETLMRELTGERQRDVRFFAFA